MCKEQKSIPFCIKCSKTGVARVASIGWVGKRTHNLESWWQCVNIRNNLIANYFKTSVFHQIQTIFHMSNPKSCPYPSKMKSHSQCNKMIVLQKQLGVSGEWQISVTCVGAHIKPTRSLSSVAYYLPPGVQPQLWWGSISRVADLGVQCRIPNTTVSRCQLWDVSALTVGCQGDFMLDVWWIWSHAKSEPTDWKQVYRCVHTQKLCPRFLWEFIWA